MSALLAEEVLATQLCEDAWCDFQRVQSRSVGVEEREEIEARYDALRATYPERFDFLDEGGL